MLNEVQLRMNINVTDTIEREIFCWHTRTLFSSKLILIIYHSLTSTPTYLHSLFAFESFVVFSYRFHQLLQLHCDHPNSIKRERGAVYSRLEYRHRSFSDAKDTGKHRSAIYHYVYARRTGNQWEETLTLWLLSSVVLRMISLHLYWTAITHRSTVYFTS